MRFVEPPELRAMYDECKPYFALSTEEVSFKEGTPDRIKELYEQWKKEYKKIDDEASLLTMR